jgi:hypothetical protein
MLALAVSSAFPQERPSRHGEVGSCVELACVQIVEACRYRRRLVHLALAFADLASGPQRPGRWLRFARPGQR